MSYFGSPQQHQQQLDFGTPNKRTALFSTPDKGTPDEGTVLFETSSPPPAGRLDFGTSSPPPEESLKRTDYDDLKDTMYRVNPETPPPPVPETKKKENGDIELAVPVPETKKKDNGDIELAVPVPEFLSSLRDRGVLSPLPSETPAFSSSLPPAIGFGSFTTAFQSPENPNNVIKISELGTNGKNRNGDSPRIDNKGLLESLIASNKCLGDPNCAKVSKMIISQTPDGTWRMSVDQEKCSPLTCDDAKAVLECFIALLRKFLPSGVYPKDFKVSNFGKNVSGQVVWFDFDFGTVNKKKPVPSIVSSGDFQFDGNELFQRLLLALIELFCPPITSFFSPPLIRDRKDVFRILNQQKGLLQRYGLLSSEKSVSETTIPDFIEVIRNLCLSEEDIGYLVGLLTPPHFSQ